MALDKFKQNIVKDSLNKDLRKKWNDESLRVKKELLDDFSGFLKSEGFSIQKDENFVKATYQESFISISISPGNSNEDPHSRLGFNTTIRYSKWGDDTVLRVTVHVKNQNKILDMTQFGQEVDLDTYTKNIKEFKPFEYLLSSEMGNDHSKIGFFGKLFATSQYGLTDSKKFEKIETLIEAVLNEEFTMKGVW